MKRTACLILVLLANLPGQALPQEPVYFADSNLKAAVEEALGISDPTPDDMLGLFFLDASNRGIVDLTGIEHATSLLELGLTNNEINDITSLSGLTSILWLDLSYNQIRSISALSGVTNIVFLFLNDNQISDISALSEFYFLLLLDLRHNPLNEDAHEIYIPLIYDNNLGLHPFWWPIDYDPPFISYYELTIESTDGGSVTIPGEGTFYYYDQESIVALKVTPEPNHHFVNWTGTALDAGKVTDPISAITTVMVDDHYALQANFAPGVFGVFFDDFRYDAFPSGHLTEQGESDFKEHGWDIKTGASGPGIAEWDANNVFFGNGENDEGIVELQIRTNGDPYYTYQSEIFTEPKFFEGTYAALIRFSDKPQSPVDGTVQTFFSISNYSLTCDKEIYSECDFEYLEYDAWKYSFKKYSPPIQESNLYVTTWEQAVPRDSIDDPCGGSLAGEWSTLVFTVDSNEVKYYLNGVLVPVEEPHMDKYYPESNMGINFNHWIDPNGYGISGDTRTYIFKVDWVLHIKDKVLTTIEVESLVREYQSHGIPRIPFRYSNENIAGW